MEVRASGVFGTMAPQEIDAMLEVMLLAACADGSLDYAELTSLKKNLRALDEDWLSHIDLEDRIADAKQRIFGEPRESRLAKLRTMLPWPEQRLLALKLAIQVARTDGTLGPTERKLVLEAAEALGIQGQLLEELVG
jgi:tellurite resistance protein